MYNRPIAFALGLLTGAAVGTSQTTPANTMSDDDKIVVLPPFEIVAEGGAGYRPEVTNVLTRTNRMIIDIPQSVDILPEEFLKDTSANMMDEAFVYVTNAQVRNSSATTSPNSILIRGFTNGSSFTDGIETGTYRRDMFGYERMEVVKGPASAVQGRGTESGYINFVLKKPTLGSNFTNTSFSYSVNEDGKEGHRVSIDNNFAINPDKGLHARVAMVYDKHDHYIDFLKFRTTALYPSIRWVLSKNTDLTLAMEFMDVEAPSRDPGHGFAWIPALYRREIPVLGDASDPITRLNLPTDFNIGGPGSATNDSLATANLIATHKFSDAIQYRQAFSLLRSSFDGEWWDAESNFPTPVASISTAYKAAVGALDPDGIYIPVQHGYINNTTYRTNIQGDLYFDYGIRNVNMVTLLGYAFKDRDSHGVNRAGTIPAQYAFINLRQPEQAWFGRTVNPGSVRVSRNNESFYEELGYYVQQDINLFEKRLMLSGGYRRDTGKSNSANYLNGTTTPVIKSTVNSWRVAGTYKIRPNVSIYGIFSTQKNPTVEGNTWGDLPAGDPRLLERFTRSPSTELREMGLKANILNNRVIATLSWYEILTTGTTTNDRVDTTSQAPDTFGQPVLAALRTIVVDGAEGKGVELSFNGKVTQNWDIMLGFGTLETQEPTSSTTYRDIRHSPTYNGSVFTKYSFENNEGLGLTLRGGYSIIGPFVQQVGGALGRIEQTDSQYRIDVGASYRLSKRHRLDVMLKNATNSAYIVTRTNPPRELRITFDSRF